MEPVLPPGLEIPAPGHLTSVNVARPSLVSYRGQAVQTAIAKVPIPGRAGAHGVNLDGDEQADLRVHGGPDKAVYAYAAEDNAWWAAELDRPIPPGTMGENLTVFGVEVSGAVVGERWSIGSAVFEVAQPRMPCFKLGVQMGSQAFVRRFSQARRPGAYLRIVREGELCAGDTVRLLSRPEHGVTIAQVFAIYHLQEGDPALLLPATELPPRVLAWAGEQVDR